MNTVFLLLAEFGQADVPVEIVAARYLGLDERQAKRPWLARITDVAAWLDKERE